VCGPTILSTACFKEYTQPCHFQYVERCVTPLSILHRWDGKECLSKPTDSITCSPIARDLDSNKIVKLHEALRCAFCRQLSLLSFQEHDNDSGSSFNYYVAVYHTFVVLLRP